MRRIISIFFLSGALLVLTALSLISHHHHHAVICTVMELCQADDTYNDRHTTHDSTGDSDGDGDGEEGCIAHASYAPSIAQEKVDTPDAQPLQTIGQAASPIVPAPATIGAQVEYRPFVIAYRSASPNPVSGLRAPPSLS